MNTPVPQSRDLLLRLEALTRRFRPELPPVVGGLNLELNPGELLTLLGPSGCGKTTTLRLIAGLDTPDAGSITIAGKEVSRLPPEKRGVGLVFQDYALFPHLTVLENVAFGLQHLPHAERLPRARETLALVGLTVFETRLPAQLSGGQQQRVALARALAPRPALLLLDEPFSNLDAGLRHSTRHELRQLLRQSGMAAILVTHDQEEALAFSDRLAVMRDGQLEQVATPDEMYLYPRTAFVANFLGRSNLLSGVAAGTQAATSLGHIGLTSAATGTVTISVRPEQVTLSETGTGARVISREFGGPSTLYTLQLEGGQTVLMQTYMPQRIEEGQQVRVAVRGSGHILDHL
ncbi:ABC transporter ATP-binding protein [Deinococcus sp.]|uniref:ABC transporter ATP-binding protein n=1 Tax=Deinococcus sp. TaxID=47478 RepID=UPI0025B88EBD|nr:ABC transporter ATP-binding protein [Deinococcus sp.]